MVEYHWTLKNETKKNGTHFLKPINELNLELKENETRKSETFDKITLIMTIEILKNTNAQISILSWCMAKEVIKDGQSDKKHTEPGAQVHRFRLPHDINIAKWNYDEKCHSKEIINSTSNNNNDWG